MLTEAEVEGVLLDQLAGLGYACLSDTVSGPDGAVPEREAYSDTILAGRLRAAVARLNPAIPEEAREDAVRYTREDLTTAEDRLRAAREAVTAFRVKNQIVDPTTDFQTQAGLITGLKARGFCFRTLREHPQYQRWIAQHGG